jgi:diguanylate cyclase (GGDEF)-like protein
MVSAAPIPAPKRDADVASNAALRDDDLAPVAIDELTPPVAAEISALIDQTLARGFWTLRFPARLEAEYNKDTAAARLKNLLIAGTVVAFISNLFLLADYAMVGDMFSTAVLLRLWIYTPLIIGGMWFMSRTPTSMLRELWVILAGVFATLINIGLCLSSSSVHAQAYLTGLSMLILYVSVFTRTQFWVSAGYTVTVIAMFGASLPFFAHLDVGLILAITLVLVSTGLFSMYHVYSLEHEDRHNYLMSKRQRVLSYELNLANQRLERLSRSDALTQVSNRRHFDEFLVQLWERARMDGGEVSVLMLDVDHFKLYNDKYGHPEGDACLVAVASALRRSMRRPGDLVARYGGEEFIAVMSKTSIDQATEAANRVCKSVAGLNMPHEGSPLYGKVTVSIGVATLRPKERDANPAQLISLADQALYQAKNRGRNRVWPPGGRTLLHPTEVLA